MPTCQRCGLQLKAGLQPTMLIQKSSGLVPCAADQAPVPSRDAWTCRTCQQSETESKEHPLTEPH